MTERNLPPDPGRTPEGKLLGQGLYLGPRIRFALLVLLGLIVLFLGIVTFEMVI